MKYIGIDFGTMNLLKESEVDTKPLARELAGRLLSESAS